MLRARVDFGHNENDEMVLHDRGGRTKFLINIRALDTLRPSRGLV